MVRSVLMKSSRKSTEVWACCLQEVKNVTFAIITSTMVKDNPIFGNTALESESSDNRLEKQLRSSSLDGEIRPERHEQPFKTFCGRLLSGQVAFAVEDGQENW